MPVYFGVKEEAVDACFMFSSLVEVEQG